MSNTARRARSETPFLDLSTSGNVGETLQVQHRTIASAQIGGSHTTGEVTIQTRLEGGQWVTLTDTANAAVKLVGPGMIRGFDVVGVDEIRPVVSVAEASKEAPVVLCAWGDER